MRRFAQIALLVLVVLVTVGLVARRKLLIEYNLWRYRTFPGSFDARTPDLCRYGASAKPALHEAFLQHGAAPDAATLRLAAVQTLRCIRAGEIAALGEAAVDLPVDPKDFVVVVRAIRAETSTANKKALIAHLAELDFRFRFAVYAALAESDLDLPDGFGRLAWVDPSGRLPKKVPAAVRAAWCAVVAPVARRIASGEGFFAARLAVFDNGPIVAALGRLRCDAEDAALAASHLAE